jgi:aryl carrier-like protein
MQNFADVPVDILTRLYLIMSRIMYWVTKWQVQEAKVHLTELIEEANIVGRRSLLVAVQNVP